MINVLTSATALDSMVVTAEAFTFTELIVSSVFNSAAVAAVSVTVIVNALLLLSLVNEAKVSRSPSLMVAVIMPVVLSSMVTSCAVVAVPESTVMASLPKPVIPPAA